MMLTKVLTISLISICAANKRKILPNIDGNEEPDTRFNRLDGPMDFRYGEHHQYSTLSPILRPGPLVPNIYHRIQYAPLHGRINQNNENAAAEYTKVTPTLSSAMGIPTEPSLTRLPPSFEKSHLEPRVPTGREVSKPMKCYGSKQNAEVLPSVSRSPGHNAVYRNFAATVQRNKPFKKNFLSPFGLYHIEPLSTTIMPLGLLPDKPIGTFNAVNKHYILNPNIVAPTGPIMDKIKRQYSPYAKLHRLHLNIARVYSQGQMAPKPTIPGSYSLNFGEIPINPQSYLPPPPVYQPVANQKTVLFPVKGNQIKYRLVMP